MAITTTSSGTRHIGIREFRDSASQVVREVRETGQEVIITVDGKPAALLSAVKSVERDAAERENELGWERMRALRTEIGADWPEGLSAVDAVREQRR